MDQDQKASGETCKLEVVPDHKRGRGWDVKVSGDCSKELKQIEKNMGPQGWRYFEKRLIRDK